MKGKAIIPLLLGLVIGFVTVKLAVDAIRKAKAANESVAMIKAVRAKQDIDAFMAISPEMIELVETADSAFAPKLDRIESLDELKDRVAVKAIPDGAAILKSMLAPPGTRPGLQGQIPPGYRAVSVKIDEVTGVAYQIKPGDWVDVIVVMDIATERRGAKETIAEVILQHVEVAAIGHETSAQQPGSSSTVKPAKSATILVKEEDVPKLHLAATRGKITLAMRGQDDLKKEPAPVATMGDVLKIFSGAWDTANKAPDPKTNTPNTAAAPPWSQPQEPMEPPHSVLVVHGAAGGGKNTTTFEMITFEDKSSPHILEVFHGPPSRARKMATEAAVEGFGHRRTSGQSLTGGAADSEAPVERVDFDSWQDTDDED